MTFGEGIMTYPCEYSSLTIPNDHAYRSLVAKYVVEVAKKIGFRESEVSKIEAGVNQAVGNVIDHSFAPEETAPIDVRCERIPVGLKVSIRDKGLPFDGKLLEIAGREEMLQEESGSLSEWFQVKDLVDEVAFNNLGREGKETVLIKHLQGRSITDYVQACELEPFDLPVPGKPEPGPDQECLVRVMAEEDAVEVSKCVYKAYGYTYGLEHVYYPERLVELNKSGRIISAVAVTPDNLIIGHCALSLRGEGARIAEMGQAVVKPEFRGLGCFSKLSRLLMDIAKSRDLMGIYGQAVSNHTYSQHVGHSLGMRDCGIILGYLPQSVTFKGITEHLSTRVSVIIHFRYLDKPVDVEVYAPLHHEEVIAKTYDHLGISPVVKKPSGLNPARLAGDPVVKTGFMRAFNSAVIDVERYGKDVVKLVKAQLKELRLKKIEIINLRLNLCDPFTAILSQEFEAMGFFYSSVLPGAMPEGDALILQYLNNVSIDYSQIMTESPFAEELLAYVKDRDPNVV